MHLTRPSPSLPIHHLFLFYKDTVPSPITVNQAQMWIQSLSFTKDIRGQQRCAGGCGGQLRAAKGDSKVNSHSQTHKRNIFKQGIKGENRFNAATLHWLYAIQPLHASTCMSNNSCAAMETLTQIKQKSYDYVHVDKHTQSE